MNNNLIKMAINKVPHFIHGKDVHGDPENTFACPSPFDDSNLYVTQGSSPAEVAAITESSNTAFQIWRKSSYLEKRRCFNNAASLLNERKQEFVNAMIEMGLPEWFAHVNVDTSIGILEECAALSSTPSGTIPQSEETKLALVFQEPVGPVLSIVPWNSPGVLCMRAVASPVLAGCSVVLKSSELAPVISYLIAKLFADSGFPHGLVNVIHHSPQQAPEITKLLIENKHIRKVTFTGSTAIGKIIATTAANVLKPVLLELGGKCASVVTSKADMDAAASAIVAGAFAHNGQICMSTERVFVVAEAYDAFLEKIVKAAQKQESAGLPQRAAVFAQRVENLLKTAEAKGAKVIFGSIQRNHTFLEPVILTGVDVDNDLHDTETFGPVFYVNKVNSVKEAIECVNRSDYGLSCGLWANNDIEAIQIARQLDTGAVHINGMTVHDEPNLPHGGVKHSGYGRFNSVWGLSEFQYTKTVSLN